MKKINILIGVLILISGCSTNEILDDGHEATDEHLEEHKHDEKKVHIHADFKVYINDKAIDFSQLMYQLRDKYIHVEDNIGDVVHVHKEDVTIADFFETLDIKFDNKCITIPIEGSYCNEGNKQLRFFVNNVENNEFEKYEIKNFDKILISYGKGDLTKQLDSITSFALRAK